MARLAVNILRTGLATLCALWLGAAVAQVPPASADNVPAAPAAYFPSPMASQRSRLSLTTVRKRTPSRDRKPEWERAKVSSSWRWTAACRDLREWLPGRLPMPQLHGQNVRL